MKRLCFMAMLALAPVIAPAPAFAQGKAERAGKVHLTLLVVHATNAEVGVDPSLQAFAESFHHLNYKGFRLLSEHASDVTLNNDADFAIEGNRDVKVTLLSRDDANVRVRVEMNGKSGKLLDTTVKINRDGTFIVAGPQFKDGILILPLRASY